MENQKWLTRRNPFLPCNLGGIELTRRWKMPNAPPPRKRNRLLRILTLRDLPVPSYGSASKRQKEKIMAKAKKKFMGRHRSVMSRVDAMQTGREKRFQPKKKKKSARGQ